VGNQRSAPVKSGEIVITDSREDKNILFRRVVDIVARGDRNRTINEFYWSIAKELVEADVIYGLNPSDYMDYESYLKSEEIYLFNVEFTFNMAQHVKMWRVEQGSPFKRIADLFAQEYDLPDVKGSQLCGILICDAANRTLKDDSSYWAYPTHQYRGKDYSPDSLS
jgi:hypothetical protein